MRLDLLRYSSKGPLSFVTHFRTHWLKSRNGLKRKRKGIHLFFLVFMQLTVSFLSWSCCLMKDGRSKKWKRWITLNFPHLLLLLQPLFTAAINFSRLIFLFTFSPIRLLPSWRFSRHGICGLLARALIFPFKAIKTLFERGWYFLYQMRTYFEQFEQRPCWRRIHTVVFGHLVHVQSSFSLSNGQDLIMRKSMFN